MTSIEVKARDGRTLMAATWGDPRGAPVFLLHGMPGSRLGQLPLERMLIRLGVRVVTYDRPGYGQSERRPGRLVRDAVEDVAAIADRLEVERFGVVGRSGGAPHALACAALLSARVVRTAALVGLAPRDAEGLDWYQGMTPSNIAAFRAGEQGLHRVGPLLAARLVDMRDQPQRMLEALRHELPPADLSVIADAGLRSTLSRNYAEALRAGVGGWVDDLLAFLQPWGFDVADIRGPVDIWHGEDDVFSPVDHSIWLARHIPHANLVLESRAAHFEAWRLLADILCRIALKQPIRPGLADPA
ncbi:pimeloyl-ACP methyl ester carboxylesterase [Streptacidiphilus sp. MAP12-33]|uniref:alpha/beta fold hydrolase n=1 Tax=Streptacidiphilus sp. MAP12-33 TaxID=3156266 RepID=UPI0035150128